MDRKYDATLKIPSLFPDKDKEIIDYLIRLPSLYFSKTGLFNLCKKFSISPDQLEQHIKKVTDEQKKSS